MLRVSKMADYATVIMSYLALKMHDSPDNCAISANKISQFIKIPAATVSKLLKILLEAGLLASQRGADGGYTLVRSASLISLAQVIRAVEGEAAITACCSPVQQCDFDKNCVARGNWKVINHFIISTLENITLEAMTRPLTLSPSFKGISIQQQGVIHVE